MPVSQGFLSVRGVSKAFGKSPSLDNVGFDLFAKEILVILGPNGAGKTTLMECLTGLLHADAGVVLRDGAELPPARRKQAIFYVPDGIAPYPEHRVMEILRLFQQLHGRNEHELRGIVERLELSDLLAKTVGVLSKGMRKRFLLAIGLLSPQPVLLLDEPFDGLDLRQTRKIISLLKETCAEGRILLLSVHQISDAEKIGDRFLLLREGRTVGMGTLTELRAHAGLPSGNLEEVFLALT